MKTVLYAHNRTAYRKVMAAFGKSSRTCVCHPTGTGKSYIVAAVSESARRVLVLAPNEFVLRQQQQAMSFHKGAEYRTYQWLHYHHELLLRQFDLIVIDEFHRAGAPEWYADVRALIDGQPQARVLGTTATPIRYLDGQRNMSDELFGGNVASEMTIAEAWTIYGALPIPRYVSGLFRWDKAAEDAKGRIERSCTLSDSEKQQRICQLSNQMIEWKLAYGMPSVLRRHLDKDARRVIVFLSHIEQLQAMRDEVAGWFREAGFAVAGVYMLHSGMTDGQCRRQMEWFESDDGGGVRLMFAVNMLNEGIHVPDVNAVIMLRITSSKNIYMQQMGRCLTAANSTKPLVLDMVDNITTTNAVRDIADEFARLELARAKREGVEPRSFEVIDYTLSVSDMIERLAPHGACTYDAEQRIAILAPWCEKHGRLPNERTDREMSNHWKWLTANAATHPEVCRLRNAYSKFRSIDAQLKPFTDFYDQYHRFPKRRNGREEQKLEAVWKRMRQRHADHPTVKAYVEREQQRLLSRAKAEMDALIAACREAKAQGRSLAKMNEYKKLMWHYADCPEVASLHSECVMKMNKRKLDDRLSEIETLCRRTGWLPRRADGETLYRAWRRIKEQYPDDMRVRQILNAYSPYDKRVEKRRQQIAEIGAFAERYGRLPITADKCYGAWSNLQKRHREEVMHLIIKYNRRGTH